MKQRLQCALRFLVKGSFRKCRNNPGEKMMLISETGHAQSVLLGSFSNIGPFNVRGDIRFADFLEWRIELPMSRANVYDFTELSSHESVINREHKAASQTC